MIDINNFTYKLFFLMSQKNITLLEIKEIEIILQENIEVFSDEEMEIILELMIDNSNDDIKLIFLSKMEEIIIKFPWSIQILIFMISEPNERVFKKTIDLLKIIDFEEIKEDVSLELNKQLQGKEKINVELLCSEREILSYELLKKIKNNSLKYDTNLEKRESINLNNMIYISEKTPIPSAQKKSKLELEISTSQNRQNPKSFYIDKYPVKNKEYDLFCEEIEEYGHIWCHADENCNKKHTRSTFYDKDSTPDAPVTGIDWYDAYSFANWKGKKLPNETQWSKAARCEDIVDILHSSKAEWTRTRYVDFGEQIPYFRGMNNSFIWNDWTAWTIVKGKIKNNLNLNENIIYLDKKLLIEKNSNIGFRCIYEPK